VRDVRKSPYLISSEFVFNIKSTEYFHPTCEA